MTFPCVSTVQLGPCPFNLSSQCKGLFMLSPQLKFLEIWFTTQIHVTLVEQWEDPLSAEVGKFMRELAKLALDGEDGGLSPASALISAHTCPLCLVLPPGQSWLQDKDLRA